MTEAEWLALDDPEFALRAIGDRSSVRKWRLLACACARFNWDSLADPRSRSAIEVSERFADGNGTAEELSIARKAAFDAAEAIQESGNETQYQASASLLWAVSPDPVRNQYAVIRHVRAYPEHGTQLVFDVIGNPFRTVILDPVWRTEAVVALAAGIYSDRAFDRMPVLADALEDAGCDLTDILAHCRGSGPHVRGCWVVDLLLSKT